MPKHKLHNFVGFFSYEDAIIAAYWQRVVEEGRVLYWHEVFDILLQKQFGFRSIELGLHKALTQAQGEAEGLGMWGKPKTHNPYQRLTKLVPPCWDINFWLARKPDHPVTLFDWRINTWQGFE